MWSATRAPTLAPACRPPQVALYLHEGAANVTVPPGANLLAAAAGAPGAEAHSSLWLGCITAANCVMAGEVVGVQDGVDSAEQCCRICRNMDGGRCNTWNWCPEAGGCR